MNSFTKIFTETPSDIIWCISHINICFWSDNSTRPTLNNGALSRSKGRINSSITLSTSDSSAIMCSILKSASL